MVWDLAPPIWVGERGRGAGVHAKGVARSLRLCSMGPKTWPEFDIERWSVRLLVQDASGRLLLLHVRDAGRADLLPWWELPGGGIEPGESPAQAAARELAEETGLVVTPADIVDCGWSRECTYQHRGRRVRQHEQILRVRIPADAPEPTALHRTATEIQDILGHRWWTVPEIQQGSERFFPGRLPELIGPALAGRGVVEPFEFWD